MMPAYWLAISLAAYRALWQLVLGAVLLGEDRARGACHRTRARRTRGCRALAASGKEA